MKNKKTIEIKGIYIGPDKPDRKYGDRGMIIFTKDVLMADYMQRIINMRAYTDETISLIAYVRERSNRIFLTGSLYD